MSAYRVIMSFDFFVVSGLAGLEKPELAIEKAGSPKETILYVGDSLEDGIQGTGQTVRKEGRS